MHVTASCMFFKVWCSSSLAMHVTASCTFFKVWCQVQAMENEDDEDEEEDERKGKPSMQPSMQPQVIRAPQPPVYGNPAAYRQSAAYGQSGANPQNAAYAHNLAFQQSLMGHHPSYAQSAGFGMRQPPMQVLSSPPSTTAVVSACVCPILLLCLGSLPRCTEVHIRFEACRD